MRRVALAFGLVVLLGACGASDRTEGAGSSRQDLTPADGATGGGSVGVAGDKKSLTAVQLGRETIRTATMTVRVEDVTGAARSAVRAAEAAGGFLEAEKTDTETTTLTLRVPPDEFTEVSDALAKLGAVADRSVATDDVTGEVADVEGRLKAARASTERVRGLLRRANTISEVTTLESELNEREAALESLQTRQRALAGKTSLASLTVTFTKPPPPVQAAPKLDGAGGFTSGLNAGWRVFRTTVSVLLVILGAVLPFALLALVVAAPVYVLRRRRATARA
ncbi:MAG TPA: DUF4349 domain-containing protein [Frankiaceae bacterium]|nr:DUF4349 domain-containing protein [Frankiaceae bacterium]